MYKYEIALILAKLAKEKAILKELEREYEAALKQINEKIMILQADPMTQSRMYQLQYQEALKAQVEAILEKMHADAYSTIQQYLSDSYTDGFVSTVYCMHKQNVPLIFPIEKAAAVKAILTDSKIKGSLYKALGINVNAMKKSIKQEITRGIASGLSYDDIIRNLRNATKAPYANCKAIVRTEGHRIQQASTEDARQQAKAKGADVVKQWDATLDGATRKTHRDLDGQIKETHEPFKHGTKEAMYPGDFGDPAEDCNCRCVALTRARWALDEDELEEMKARAEYFGLDKSDSFEDFKKKYLNAAETVEKSGNLRYNSGGLMGAYNDENDPYNEKREAHAKLYYEELRNSSKTHFVDAVSKNSSVDAETVAKAYQHVFSDKHMLDNKMQYFDPDYYMAESFRRLRTNSSIQEHDKVLLRHEALEYDLMQANPDMTYEEAHRMAEKAHNYKKALMNWLKKEGK